MFIYSQIAGLSLLAGGLLLAHSHNRKNSIANLLKRGTKTEGKVIEIRRNPGSLFSKKDGEGYAPVVEYTTVSGNVLKHYSTTYKPVSPYKEGQIVPIFYINYKSIREAALTDDEPGDFPRKLFVVGALLLLIGMPAVLDGLFKFL